MLDPKFIRENQKEVEKAIKNKGYKIDLAGFLKLDDKRKVILGKVEDLRAEQNKLSKGIKGKPTAKQVKASKKIKTELEKISPELKKLDDKWNETMLQIPNIPSDKSPVGPDESANKEIKIWGKIPKFSFPVLDHLNLGLKNNIIDIERAVKTGGTRSYILKNELVILEQAVLRHALDKIRKEGFEVMNVPVIVNQSALVNSAFFPQGKDDVYHLEDDKYLVGTSEVSLVNYHSGETLQESELPRLLGGISTCFRREVGTYGKDTKGVIRVHQFNKVEQVVICKPEEAEKYFNFILNIHEEIIRAFEIPYRLVEISTGDMGPKNHRQVDLEAWFPSQNKYRELASCSWLTDFQARRANIKYRTDSGEKIVAHTLNCTAIATPRFLAALIENYQQKDGSIKVPRILKPFVPFDKIST